MPTPDLPAIHLGYAQDLALLAGAHDATAAASAPDGARSGSVAGPSASLPLPKGREQVLVAPAGHAINSLIIGLAEWSLEAGLTRTAAWVQQAAAGQPFQFPAAEVRGSVAPPEQQLAQACDFSSPIGLRPFLELAERSLSNSLVLPDSGGGGSARSLRPATQAAPGPPLLLQRLTGGRQGRVLPAAQAEQLSLPPSFGEGFPSTPPGAAFAATRRESPGSLFHSPPAGTDSSPLPGSPYAALPDCFPVPFPGQEEELRREDKGLGSNYWTPQATTEAPDAPSMAGTNQGNGGRARSISLPPVLATWQARPGHQCPGDGDQAGAPGAG